MKIYLDRKLNECWYGRRGVVAWLLSPLSLLYRGCVFFRRLAFKLHLIKVYAPSVPVVVVGNITLGGVGKTPVVAAFAAHCMAQGKTVGIVSRGYGGCAKTWPQTVTAESDPALVGDEPVMLARQLGCHVVVSPKRADAVSVCETRGCDIIFSDDGLTHYYFKRAFECVVVDGGRGLGNGFCLPAGPLREPASRLNAVPLVLTNTVGRCDESHFHLAPLCFINLESGDKVSLREFKKIAVHAVSAIGNNARFFQTLLALGCEVVEHSFPDHYPLSDKDVFFEDEAPVVMTEKDAVKCGNIRKKKKLWFLQVRAEIHPTVYKKLNTITD